jgi:hypothetical protein
MDRLILLDTRNDKHFVGSTLTDVVLSSGAVTFDLSARRAVIYGQLDTVSFSRAFTDKELVHELACRALTVLKRYDFQLFKNIDA